MLRIPFLAIGLLAAAFSAPSQALDLHAFWDNRCAECHGHAGTFARTHLHIENGALAGRHNRDLERFLAQHEAGSAQAAALYAMLLAQTQTGPVYHQKCTGCHDTAATFARSSLTLRDGVVIGRVNQRPIAEYLKRHGKLAADEIPVVVETLTRIHGETGGTSAR